MVHRVPEELQLEVCSIVQEVVTKIIPKRNSGRQSDCLRRPYKQLRKEVKGKGEREIYDQLNAEFQRTARRDKKVFSSEQCKEMETIEWERPEISSRKLEISRKSTLNLYWED